MTLKQHFNRRSQKKNYYYILCIRGFGLLEQDTFGIVVYFLDICEVFSSYLEGRYRIPISFYTLEVFWREGL